MSEELNPKDFYFYVQARLECGAEIQIMQRTPEVPWEFILAPKQGTELKDFARIHDGELRVNIVQESVLGIYQLLGMIINTSTRRRKFLGLF